MKERRSLVDSQHKPEQAGQVMEVILFLQLFEVCFSEIHHRLEAVLDLVPIKGAHDPHIVLERQHLRDAVHACAEQASHLVVMRQRNQLQRIRIRAQLICAHEKHQVLDILEALRC